jgi:hypothetical protein
MTRAKDISKILTDADISGTLDVTGETTLATHLNLGDNDIIKLGASADLQIYHNASHSFIQDVGTGSLKITSDGNGVDINKGTSENIARFLCDGAVELYHDNSKKFETTSSGVDVSGTTVNIDGGGSNPSLNVKNSDTYYMTLGHDSINVNQNALKLKVNGSTFFQMDSGGHITMGSQPAFLATKSSIQSNIAINSIVQITFDGERFDQNGDFSSSTFTAPVTGRYQFNVVTTLAELDQDSAYVEFKLETSNVTYTHPIVDPDGFDQDLPYFTITYAQLVDMDANDTAKASLYIPNGSAQTDVRASQSFFSGYLVC